MANVLFIIKTPPPVTGATLMNQYVADGLTLEKPLDKHLLKVSYEKQTSKLGKPSLRKGLRFIGVFFKLLGRLISLRPCLVYFQLSTRGLAFYRDMLFVLLLRVTRRSIIYHIHAKGLDKEINKSGLNRRLYSIAFRHQHVIFLADRFRQEIPESFAIKSYVLPNGIPEREGQIGKPLEKLANEPIRLLFLSNLIESKGILDFMQVCLRLHQNQIPFKATVVGADASVSAQQLKSWTKEQGLEYYLDIKGPLYDAAKWEIMSQADVLVFPTFYPLEAFPLVVLEAFQYGLPVLAYKEGALPEMIQSGYDGQVFESRDIESIAATLSDLQKNSELLSNLSINALKTYQEKYTLSRFHSNLAQVIAEAAGQ